jgi:hypothetical protein
MLKKFYKTGPTAKIEETDALGWVYMRVFKMLKTQMQQKTRLFSSLKFSPFYPSFDSHGHRNERNNLMQADNNI